MATFIPFPLLLTVQLYAFFCSIFVEEATKSVTLKLAEFSEPRFYHQFGKNEQKILFVMCKWLDLPVSSIGN